MGNYTSTQKRNRVHTVVDPELRRFSTGSIISRGIDPEREKREFNAASSNSNVLKSIVGETMKSVITSLIPSSIHQTFTSSKLGGAGLKGETNLLLSVIPKAEGDNILITVTNGGSLFFYSIWTLKLMIKDQNSVLSNLANSKNHHHLLACYDGNDMKHRCELFIEALVDCIVNKEFNFRTANQGDGTSYAAFLFLNMLSSVDDIPQICLEMTMKQLRNPESIQFAMSQTLFELYANNYNSQQLNNKTSNHMKMELQHKQQMLDSLEEQLHKSREENSKHKKAVFSAFAKKDTDRDSKKLSIKTEFSEDGEETIFEVPVNKVLDILQSWKAHTSSSDESIKLEYIMKVIKNESLYEVDVDQIVSKEKDVELQTWIQSELLQGHKKRGWNTVKAYSKAIYFAKKLKERDSTQEYVIPELDIPSNIIEALEGLESYNWDVFKLDQVSGGRPLYYLALKIFEIHDLYSRFKIPINKFRDFLDKIEKGYISNPYHNKIHAADVLHTVNFFVNNLKQKDTFDKIDLLAIFTTAVMHDYQHPGVNNGFEVKTLSDRALLYNDQSVLENFHCTSFFRLIREEKCNFLEMLNEEELKHLRDALIHMVLGTDMGQHFIILSQIRNSILKEFNSSKRDDKFSLMRLLLKCADVSNPTKCIPLYSIWADRVIEEFHLQGDKEKDLGLIVSPFMDRAKPNLGKSQIGFIDYICKPLFECLVSFADEFSFILDQISSNREHYAAMVPQDTSAR